MFAAAASDASAATFVAAAAAAASCAVTAAAVAASPRSQRRRRRTRRRRHSQRPLHSQIQHRPHRLLVAVGSGHSILDKKKSVVKICYACFMLQLLYIDIKFEKCIFFYFYKHRTNYYDKSSKGRNR